MKKNLYIEIMLTVIAIALIALIFEPTFIRPRLQMMKWYREQEYILRFIKNFNRLPKSTPDYTLK